MNLKNDYFMISTRNSNFPFTHGKEINGRILKADKEYVTFETDKGTVTVREYNVIFPYAYTVTDWLDSTINGQATYHNRIDQYVEYQVYNFQYKHGQFTKVSLAVLNDALQQIGCSIDNWGIDSEIDCLQLTVKYTSYDLY